MSGPKSRDQTTKRGGGAFYPDGRPMHFVAGTGGPCSRCQTPAEAWKVTPCFYPAILEEIADEVCEKLESVCTTQVGLTVREACEQALRLRSMLVQFPHDQRLAELVQTPEQDG